MAVKLGRTTDKQRILPSVIVAVPASSQRANSDNSVQFTFGGGTITTDSGSSRIVYTTNRKGDQAKSNWCWHNRIRTKYNGDATSKNVVTQASPGLYHYDLYQQHTQSESSHAAAVTTFKALAPTSGTGHLGRFGQDYINLAFSELKPDFTEVSLPNFLYDIGQLSQLYKLWRKNIDIAKNLAGAHLNYKFGWKPTAGDLKGMFVGMLGLRKKLGDFVAGIGNLNHRSKTVYKNTLNQSGSFNTGDVNYQCEWSGTLVQTATAHVVYRCLPLSNVSFGPLDLYLRASLDTLGVELNPRIIWDAIPYSFVVDWFLGVGRYLDQFRVDALELPIVLLDSYVQYKEKLVVTSLWNEGKQPSFPQGPVSYSGGWFTEETFFNRVPLKPDYASLAGLQWKTPTTGQALLLLSLAEVKLGPVSRLIGRAPTRDLNSLGTSITDFLLHR